MNIDRMKILLGGLGLLASSAATTFLLITLFYYKATTGRWTTHLVFDIYSEHIIEVPLLALGGIASLYEGVKYLLRALSSLPSCQSAPALFRRIFLYSFTYLWISAIVFLQAITRMF